MQEPSSEGAPCLRLPPAAPQAWVQEEVVTHGSDRLSGLSKENIPQSRTMSPLRIPRPLLEAAGAKAQREGKARSAFSQIFDLRYDFQLVHALHR